MRFIVCIFVPKYDCFHGKLCLTCPPHFTVKCFSFTSRIWMPSPRYKTKNKHGIDKDNAQILVIIWRKSTACHSVCAVCRSDYVRICYTLLDSLPWRRHQMETFSALLALCVGNSPVTLMFSLICAWTDGSLNNRDAVDLRCHRAHCDVIVMIIFLCIFIGYMGQLRV